MQCIKVIQIKRYDIFTEMYNLKMADQELMNANSKEIQINPNKIHSKFQKR